MSTPCDRHCDHGDQIEAARTQYGHGPNGRGSHSQRASGRGGTLEDSTNIWNWKWKLMAGELVRDEDARDQYIRAVAEGIPMKKFWEALLEAAGGMDAARAGTAQHSDLERWGRGLPMRADIDEDSLMSVAAVERLFKARGYKVVLTEIYVVVDEVEVVGSMDLIVKEEATGRYLAADYKTSEAMNDRRYPRKTAVQLAQYAHGRRWCPVSGWLPMPPVDQSIGLLISVPLHGATAIATELDLEVGWIGARIAYDVSRWRKTNVLA